MIAFMKTFYVVSVNKNRRLKCTKWHYTLVTFLGTLDVKPISDIGAPGLLAFLPANLGVGVAYAEKPDLLIF